MPRKAAKRKWMKRAFGKHPGKLHRRLHVRKGEKIPASKLRKAAHSRDPELRKEVALAKVGKWYAGKRHKKTRSSARAR